MIINDKFAIEDAVSGLRIKVVPGHKQDCLCIEHMIPQPQQPVCGNRDFWFTKDGEFTGTGSVIGDRKKSVVDSPEPE